MDASEFDRASRASLGDASAWREVVVGYGPLVLGLCHHLSRDPDAAFRAIWRQVQAELSAWDRRQPLDHWIVGHAHRHLLGTAGRPAVGAVVQFGERGPRARSPTRAPLDAAALPRTLAMLPVERRRVVVLRHLARVPSARIAFAEGIPVAAVDAHLHHGRAFLARRLVDDRPPWEELSSLLEGELPPDERARIEERVAGEPELALAWKDMRALGAALDDLERPPVPTALLNDVAAVPARGRMPPASAWPWLVAVLAVALVIPLAMRSPPAVRARLDPGVHELDGHVVVTAGGSVVDLDGRARIGLDAGGEVTVEVYEGRALVTRPDRGTVVVPRGQRLTGGEVSAASSGAP